MCASLSRITWVSPDGGEWWFEAAHFPAPVSRMFAGIIDTICEGWVTGAERWGLEREGSRWAYVNGYVFYGQRGDGAAGDSEVAERARRERWWVDEAGRWFEDERPQVVAVNRALQAVDVDALDDAALAAHVKDAAAHLLRVAPLHFEHRGREVVLKLLREKMEAEGVDPKAMDAAFEGASPSTSRPRGLLADVVRALRDDGRDPVEIASLEDVRSSPLAAAALDRYLDEYAHRLLDSYDLACPMLGERPDVIVASIRATAMARPVRRAAASLPAMSGELRQLLDEARVSYGIEDDDDGVCIFWPSGLLRRALLALARRRGLVDLLVVFEVGLDELEAFVDGGGPSVDELTGRAAARAAAASLTPPPSLGGAPHDRVEAAAPEATDGEWRGTGAGSGVGRGRACVVRGTGIGDALDRIEPGDVLIAPTTTPGHNALMPILAAMATETNMGHTIICAREFGIPTVVGIPGLVAAIPDGAMVEVDAAAGVVRIVEGAP